jgi:hypothetical protein
MKNTMTLGQFRDFAARVKAILAGTPITCEGYQAFHAGGRTAEFGDRLRALIQEFFTVVNPFAGEKTAPNRDWDYTATSLPTVGAQLASLEIGLDLTGFTLKQVSYPIDPRADGMLVIPFLRDLGTAFEVTEPTGNGYGPLGELVWGKVSAARKGAAHNYRAGELSSDYIRLNADVRARLEALEVKVPAEEGVVHCHVIPVNSGNLYAGFGPRNARFDSLQKGMLPLGFVQILCMMLAWPERLAKYGVRWIDCSADEYSWQADGAWADCPYVDFRGDWLKLCAVGAGYAHSRCGSAVAFPGVQ